MNHTIVMVFLAALTLAGCGATTSSQPLAETPVQANALPRTEEDLRHLNDVHVSIVRRAERQCSVEGTSVTPGNEFELPCLVSSVDRSIETSGDEALRAYHNALPRRVRYDPRRSDNVWRDMIADAGEEGF